MQGSGYEVWRVGLKKPEGLDFVWYSTVPLPRYSGCVGLHVDKYGDLRVTDVPVQKGVRPKF